ncbi:hypothetical protein SAMD00019534_078420 [Acytostelium subglobosum LB1]|uniref:hypothetical protein n=1 Tax=Acytostelium subglobosum LB1 TaxID=1410327 RepID=UPI000644C6E9|nr:hypothetical protein SAMD00019534_078420 [Acytostelium subglobosum LB1]GAM24667.1 hypothetical protein SAMD00019534_078420 [Acytostelium subglobosum LB1]|eukprot:XP_012752336.1 hypothetical protein SAMD00019534_078420 [Acytostelium subglobosum LB1]
MSQSWWTGEINAYDPVNKTYSAFQNGKRRKDLFLAEKINYIVKDIIPNIISECKTIREEFVAYRLECLLNEPTTNYYFRSRLVNTTAANGKQTTRVRVLKGKHTGRTYPLIDRKRVFAPWGCPVEISPICVSPEDLIKSYVSPISIVNLPMVRETCK